MSDAWIRLAHVGMHPDRLRQLLDDSGSPAEIVRAIARGAIRVPDRARAAAKVPPASAMPNSKVPASDFCCVAKPISRPPSAGCPIPRSSCSTAEARSPVGRWRLSEPGRAPRTEGAWPRSTERRCPTPAGRW